MQVIAILPTSAWTHRAWSCSPQTSHIDQSAAPRSRYRLDYRSPADDTVPLHIINDEDCAVKPWIQRSLATISALAVVVGASNAAHADDALPSITEVTSESGIKAQQLAPSDATERDRDLAITQHLESTPTPMATGQYYSYCEEGSSGLMVWTDNSPKYCYG